MNFRSDKRPKQGDVVRLKHIEGPRLLVLEVLGDEVTVGWFDLAMKYHSETFSHVMLLKEDNIEKTYVSKAGLDFGHVVYNAEFQNHVQSNRKIQAIKVARAISGVGLKEAKDFVEEYMSKHV